MAGQAEEQEDWEFWGDSRHVGISLLTLTYPCRARMVLRVTEEKMASQDSL